MTPDGPLGLYPARYIQLDISGQIYLAGYIWQDISSRIYLAGYIWPDTSGRIHLAGYLWPDTFVWIDLAGYIWPDTGVSPRWYVDKKTILVEFARNILCSLRLWVFAQLKIKSCSCGVLFYGSRSSLVPYCGCKPVHQVA